MRPSRSESRATSTPDRHAVRLAATATLLSVGAIHAAWGSGSSWPMADRAELSDAVLGSPGLAHGGATACYTVAALLGAAAAIVSGRPHHAERPRWVAVNGIAAALAGPGVLGLTGHTHVVSPTSTGDRFRRLDRRYYSPACLALAALVTLSRPGAEPRATAPVAEAS